MGGGGIKDGFKAITSLGCFAAVTAKRMAKGAPAEWPATIEGASIPNWVMRSCSERAISSSLRSSNFAPKVKAWPGKSGTRTCAWFSNKGIKSDQEWVELPVPCNSKTTGPLPVSCTCQSKSPTEITLLYCRLGQSRGIRFMTYKNSLSAARPMVGCSSCGKWPILGKDTLLALGITFK